MKESPVFHGPLQELRNAFELGIIQNSRTKNRIAKLMRTKSSETRQGKRGRKTAIQPFTSEEKYENPQKQNAQRKTLRRHVMQNCSTEGYETFNEKSIDSSAYIRIFSNLYQSLRSALQLNSLKIPETL